MPRSKGRTGKPYLRVRARMLRASTICALCGHDGADCIDHIKPLALGGAPLDPNNMQVAHQQPCPTCGVRCNPVKGIGVIPTLPTSSAW